MNIPAIKKNVARRNGLPAKTTLYAHAQSIHRGATQRPDDGIWQAIKTKAQAARKNAPPPRDFDFSWRRGVLCAVVIGAAG
jgi:hypothetical protein